MRFCVLLTLGLCASLSLAQKPGQPAEDDGAPAYLLRYKLKNGDTLHYNVTHVGETETRIQGKTERTRSRTVSTKVWHCVEVNKEGEMTFEHRVDSVELDQHVGEDVHLTWNSQSDAKPPQAFADVAQTLGKPLARLRINAQGQVKEREDFAGTRANLGMGELTIPLPKDPVRIGGRWIVPREIRVRNEDGEALKIKIRELYELEKVETGIATISIASQPLTPIDDNSVKAQIVQQLSNGNLKFDVQAGRLINKTLEWDETVVGFRGADSMLEYDARLVEEHVKSPATRTASRP